MTIIGSALAITIPANATSPYDSIVQPIYPLQLGTKEYPGIFSVFDGIKNKCSASDITSFRDFMSQEDNYWAITNGFLQGTNQNNIYIVMGKASNLITTTDGAGTTQGKRFWFDPSDRAGLKSIRISSYDSGTCYAMTSSLDDYAATMAGYIISPGQAYPSYYIRPSVNNFPNISYPDGYEGVEFPASVAPNNDSIKPVYQWSGNKEGLLNIQYMKNIEPFLSGSSAIVINKMGTNWQGLGAEVHNQWYSPAGWLNENIQLPEAGYYMIRIDHNQSLQTPPWKVPLPHIEQVWIQIRWDGENIIPMGNNLGDCSGICNSEKNNTKADNQWWKLFNSLDAINTHGLQRFFLAPVTFFQTLPSKMNSCTPITIPFIQGKSFQLECLKDRYWEWSPVVMTIYTTVINALVAYAVATRVFSLIKDMSTPQKDGIEVAKL